MSNPNNLDLTEQAVTYSDYLYALSHFEEVALQKQISDEKNSELNQEFLRKQSALDNANNKLTENRTEYDELHREAFDKAKEYREVGIRAFRERINKEISEENKKRLKKIDKIESEFNEILDEYYKREKELYINIRSNKETIKEADYQKKILYEAINNPPDVYSEDVLHLLEKSQKQQLFTEHQKNLLEKNAPTICDGRIYTRQDLLDEERKFAESVYVNRIKHGYVTSEVIDRFAKSSAKIIFSLLCIFGVLALDASFNPFVTAIRAAISGFFFGGITVKAANSFITKKLFNNKPPIPKTAVSVLAGFIGVSLGLLIWHTCIYEHSGALVRISIAIATAFSAYFYIKLVGWEALHKFWGESRLLRRMSRKYVFRDFDDEEGQANNLRIYYYLNHYAVLDHLTVIEKQQIHRDETKRLEIAHNLRQTLQKEQEKLEEKLPEIIQKQEEALKQIDQINLDFCKFRENLKQELTDYKHKELIADVPQKFKKELQILDSKYNKLIKQRNKRQKDLDKVLDLISEAEPDYKAKTAEYNRLTHILKQWSSTPMPHETDFKLNPMIYFVTSNRVFPLKHNLKPFVITYKITNKSANPIMTLRNKIFNYTREFMKVNSSRMFQVNIIDPVSNTDIITKDDAFRKLSLPGVVQGINHTSSFEIRLISCNTEYSALKLKYRNNCKDVAEYLKEHKDEIPPNSMFSTELANSILQSDTEPFMYQLMLFVVPRAFDKVNFPPPKDIIKIIEEDKCASLGILPVFFVDRDSVHKDWQDFMNFCYTKYMKGH